MNTAPVAADIPMVRVPRSASPVPTRQRLRSIRLPIPAYFGTAALLVPALILASVQLGWFSTTGRVDASTGQAITLDAGSVGADIRGWMTLSQVLDGFAVARADFDDAFPAAVGVPTDAKMGELSEEAGIELEAVRAWIDARLVPTATAEPATDAAGKAPTSTTSPAETVATAPAESAAPTHTPQPSSAAAGTPAGDGDAAGTPPEIRGKTTVEEMLAVTGRTLAAFVAAFSLPADVDPATRLVDLLDRDGSAVAVDAVRDWAAN